MVLRVALHLPHRPSANVCNNFLQLVKTVKFDCFDQTIVLSLAPMALVQPSQSLFRLLRWRHRNFHLALLHELVLRFEEFGFEALIFSECDRQLLVELLVVELVKALLPHEVT